MGKGENKTEWKQKVDDAYQIWKYNDLHSNIKAHFKDERNKSRMPDALKKEIDENSPVLKDLTSLRDTMNTEEIQEKGKLFVRDCNENITFLGSKIEIPGVAADDDEVDYTLSFHTLAWNFCRDNNLISCYRISVITT